MLRRASTKIAHNSTIPVLRANQDLKPLQNLIIAEKAVLISLKKLSVDYSKASDALKTWSLKEGKDLEDILSASSSLLNIFSSALVEYATHGDFMRKQLKVIRTKEESLENLKRSRHNARRKAKNLEKKLTKMGPDHKNFTTQKESFIQLQEEIRKMDSGIMLEEAALVDLKRTATKAWMGLKFGGLVQCCQKGTIAGEFGKLTIGKLLEETTRPRMPHRPAISSDNQVKDFVEEAVQRVNTLVLSVIPSVGFRNKDEHNRASESSNSPPASSPTGPEPSSEPQQEQPPPTSTLPVSNESNLQTTIQPNHRGKGQAPPETPVPSGNSSSENPPHISPYQPQPSQGEPQQQPPPTSALRGSNESNLPTLQPNRRRKGQPPETPVSSSSASAPPYQQQPSQGEPQQPPPRSALRGSNESNPQTLQPNRRGKGQPPETPVSSSSASAPPYQQQPTQGEPQQPPPRSALRGSNESNPQIPHPIRRGKGRPPEASVSSSSPSAPPYQQQPSQGEPQQPPPRSALRGSNETNPQTMPPNRRGKGQAPPEMPVSSGNSSPPYVPPYQQQPSQSEPHRQSPPRSALRGSNENNPQTIQHNRRGKGQAPPETPASSGNLNSLSEYPPYVPPYQQQPSPGEPQLQPPPRSTLRGPNESTSQTIQSNHRGGGHGQAPPETLVSSGNSSSYPPHVPPYQPHLSQGNVHSSSTQSLPLSQHPGVNGWAVHRNNTTVAISSSRLATSPVPTPVRVNTCLPSSSRSRVYDDPPPSFNDALLARRYVPVVGSTGEGSHANNTTAGHGHSNSVLLAAGPKMIPGNGKRRVE